ncbi:hypothetical protein CP10139811_0435 [Chlamydia ibidis]|uniref:Rubrerythrin family protein n=2 Tax=Chlamydia ibidis TaxID=1405396 RepID=S7J467_9CHLA|nr:hypothetical protein [Chlamydia ibidis]EPP34802.1 hypothetical protein CP10139811_0435 [Chlamydia ibidis]EQM62374.1 hypothetical protein H359_0811 [Chlamydia ibidis 10-1398/6]
MLTSKITTFISYAEQLSNLLESIVESDELHAKWINTLSFLENCGAKKISLSEHPTKVQKEVLKHASEEFRHAFYLKTQISKIPNQMLPNYSLNRILGGFASLHYLNNLDLYTCRLLKNRYCLLGQQLKTTAYILVTSAIEIRASELYPLYQDILKSKQSKITVKSIILEEQEHLKEMENELTHIPHYETLLSYACQIESNLCSNLINTLKNDVQLFYHSI